MKLINLSCPNCGSQLSVDSETKQAKCEACGNIMLIDDSVQHVQYDNAEMAGYEFEKGRQRAQAERFMQSAQPQQKSNVKYWQNTEVNKNNKSNIWLWVLGWLFFFPLPLTLLLVRNKNLNPVIKYSIIGVMWTIIGFFSIASYVTRDKPSSNYKEGNLEKFYENYKESGTYNNVSEMANRYGLACDSVSVGTEKYYKVAVTRENASVTSENDLRIGDYYVLIQFDGIGKDEAESIELYDSRSGTNIYGEEGAKEETKDISMEDSIGSLVEQFNSQSEKKMSFIEDFVPSDENGSHYQHEFRLNAYNDAIGKSYSYDDTYIDIVARYDIFNETHIRVYVNKSNLQQCKDIIKYISPAMDGTIKDSDIQNAIDYIDEKQDANGYSYGDLTIVLQKKSIDSFELMIKKSND